MRTMPYGRTCQASHAHGLCRSTDLLETDDGNLLFLLLLSSLLGQLVVHLAAAHDHPLEPLLLGGVGGPGLKQTALFRLKELHFATNAKRDMPHL